MVFTEDKTKLINAKCLSLYICELWSVESLQNDFKFAPSYTLYIVVIVNGHKSYQENFTRKVY